MYRKIVQMIDALPRLATLDRRIDEAKINQGRILSELHRDKAFSRLSDYEFKVFSQWGEDGIIQFLVSNLKIGNKTFIEFGVETFFESNCRYLMMKDNWRGFVIDGSSRNLARLQRSYFFHLYDLRSRVAFITRDNIRALLDESEFDKDVGILSVDIDGVDYYVLGQLDQWRPCILIVEYNALFGKERAVSVPYAPDFVRSRQHHSNLYYGASLAAFDCLAKNRGYALVGVNGAGSNAFFVRRDLLNDKVREVPLAQEFQDSKFRESRDVRGNLTFVGGDERTDLIHDMLLIDVISGERLKVGDLYGRPAK